jgi:hypothetical protein
MTRPVKWFNKMFQPVLKLRSFLKLSNQRCQNSGGRKAKDTVARTNNWNDTTSFANVANALKGFARDWLFATVEMLHWEGN